jgi:hypothetical protein
VFARYVVSSGVLCWPHSSASNGFWLGPPGAAGIKGSPSIGTTNGAQFHKYNCSTRTLKGVDQQYPLCGQRSMQACAPSIGVEKLVPANYVELSRTSQVVGHTSWWGSCVDAGGSQLDAFVNVITLLCSHNCQALLSAFLSFLVSATSFLVRIGRGRAHTGSVHEWAGFSPHSPWGCPHLLCVPSTI